VEAARAPKHTVETIRNLRLFGLRARRGVENSTSDKSLETTRNLRFFGLRVDKVSRD